tara:strand:+ start:1557 stop:2357 length:801 start_codon:yes stop_codon:yes gene_type:complete
MIKHPVMRYHGGKFRLAKWITSFFGEHYFYTEAYGGAASVLMHKEPAYSEVYNDMDGDVVNLFRVLKDPASNERLRELCAFTPYSRDEFKNAFDATEEDPVIRALNMVVRATMGFGTAAGVGGNSGFRSDSKRKYATASHLWARYPDNLASVGERLAGVMIENKPATEVILKHDCEFTLHYVDPPYVHNTRVAGNRSYRHEMSDNDHEELIAVLSSVKGRVLLSGYDCDLYRDCLAGWRVETKPSRISAGRGTKVKNEMLWISPDK